MNNTTISVIFIWALLILMSGCENECEEYESICRDNQVYYCHVPHAAIGANTWRFLYDCNETNATCMETTLYYQPIEQFNLESGCIYNDVSCATDDEQKCVDDGNMIVDCNIQSLENVNVPVVIQTNDEEAPYCVEKTDGTAGFAYLDEECTTPHERMCVDAVTVACDNNGLWQLATELGCILEY